MGSMPHFPIPKRTHAELVALLATMDDSRTDAMVERMERQQRYQAARKLLTTPEATARKRSMDMVRKVRKVVSQAGEATRYAAALHLLGAMPMELEPVERRAEALQANAEAGTARVQALAAAGDPVARAYLAEVQE